jgi:hypothetical protein
MGSGLLLTHFKNIIDKKVQGQTLSFKFIHQAHEAYFSSPNIKIILIH